jgi:hypothetical protein
VLSVDTVEDRDGAGADCVTFLLTQAAAAATALGETGVTRLRHTVARWHANDDWGLLGWALHQRPALADWLTTTV